MRLIVISSLPLHCIASTPLIASSHALIRFVSMRSQNRYLLFFVALFWFQRMSHILLVIYSPSLHRIASMRLVEISYVLTRLASTRLQRYIVIMCPQSCRLLTCLALLGPQNILRVYFIMTYSIGISCVVTSYILDLMISMT